MSNSENNVIFSKGLSEYEGIFSGFADTQEEKELLKNQFVSHALHFDYIKITLLIDKKINSETIRRVDGVAKINDDIILIEKCSPDVEISKKKIEDALDPKNRFKGKDFSFWILFRNNLSVVYCGYKEEINLFTYTLKNDKEEYRISFYNKIEDKSSNIYKNHKIIE